MNELDIWYAAPIVLGVLCVLAGLLITAFKGEL
jgi:hypothetical protein